MTAPVSVCPTHTEMVFTPSKLLLIGAWAAEIIKQERIEAIAACGHSGLPLGGLISATANVPLFAVRKAWEKPLATSSMVTGIAPHGPVKRWAWLDDFISVGRTLTSSIYLLREYGLIEDPYPAILLSYNCHCNERTSERISAHQWETNVRLPYDVDRAVIRQYGFKEWDCKCSHTQVVGSSHRTPITRA